MRVLFTGTLLKYLYELDYLQNANVFRAGRIKICCNITPDFEMTAG